MIAINSEILDEAEIIGGVAQLIRVQMWGPNKSGAKLIITAAKTSIVNTVNRSI